MCSNTHHRSRRIAARMPPSGEVLAVERFEQKRFVDHAVTYGVAAHESRLFGRPNQVLDLFLTTGLLAMSVLGALRGKAGADAPDRDRFWERRRAVHLLTHKVHCGRCGGVMSNVGRDYLACAAARRQGVCGSTRGIRRQELDRLILLHPEVGGYRVEGRGELAPILALADNIVSANGASGALCDSTHDKAAGVSAAALSVRMKLVAGTRNQLDLLLTG